MKALKVFVTVPREHADAVRTAIGDAGGGQIGNYSFCSFSVVGIGRFKPERGAHPSIGEVGSLVAVEEEKIEFVCDPALLEVVVEAIRSVHPYEEPAIDAISVEIF
ncbi:MAG TPA: hypothetical protein VNM40_02015 [Candidatus Paceibacterota bacterium]|nr:hypothetical protein [Candidatus Paceibacterota bacterium]